jgi:hypothetical protein
LHDDAVAQDQKFTLVTATSTMVKEAVEQNEEEEEVDGGGCGYTEKMKTQRSASVKNKLRVLWTNV